MASGQSGRASAHEYDIHGDSFFSRRLLEDEPVPDHLIRRVLEAGRFAPSAGNCQPWQFIVITDRALIQKMDEAVLEGRTVVINKADLNSDKGDR